MPVSVTIQTRYNDLDAQGHVNNIAQLQIIETSRRVLFKRAGLPKWNPGQVVRRQEIEYFAPIPPHHDEVVVEMSCIAIGRTSYTLEYRLLDDRGNVFSQSTVVLVSIDGNGHPATITVALKTALESLAGVGSVV